MGQITGTVGGLIRYEANTCGDTGSENIPGGLMAGAALGTTPTGNSAKEEGGVPGRPRTLGRWAGTMNG